MAAGTVSVGGLSHMLLQSVERYLHVRKGEQHLFPHTEFDFVKANFNFPNFVYRVLRLFSCDVSCVVIGMLLYIVCCDWIVMMYRVM